MLIGGRFFVDTVYINDLEEDVVRVMCLSLVMIRNCSGKLWIRCIYSGNAGSG